MKSFGQSMSAVRLSALAAMACVAAAGSAQASGVGGAVILPNAVSYEYFGLNFANNIVTSHTVGTLDYSGHPGCGGVCSATTALGASPSISATVNEVLFQATGGGIVEVDLGYYVEYLNAAGTYGVNLEATDSLTSNDGAQMAANLKFGQAGPSTSSLNNFATLDFLEVDCVNGCPPESAGGSTGPFAANHTVQMVANTPYYLQLSLFYRPSSVGVTDTGMIDPMFTDPIFGGNFVFSPGVLGAPIGGAPEPATWAMMLMGFGGLGHMLRRRRAQRAFAEA